MAHAAMGLTDAASAGIEAGSQAASVGAAASATSGATAATAATATLPAQALDIGACLQKHLTQSLISHGVRAGFGEDIKDPLESLGRSVAAGALGQWAASKIGVAYADPTNPLDPISHKFAHAALGAATGALMGGTGCVASGALAGALSEWIAESVYDGTNMDAAEKAAKIFGAASGLLTGNISVAARAAENAIDHNFMKFAAMVAFQKAKNIVKKYISKKLISKTLNQNISGYTKHGLNRKIEREVSSKKILNAVKEPLKVTESKFDHLGRESQRFIGKDATVAMNPKTGKILSVNPTSSKLAERLLKK